MAVKIFNFPLRFQVYLEYFEYIIEKAHSIPIQKVVKNIFITTTTIFLFLHYLLVIISYFASVMMHSSFIFKEIVLKLQDSMNDEFAYKKTFICIFLY